MSLIMELFDLFLVIALLYHFPGIKIGLFFPNINIGIGIVTFVLLCLVAIVKMSYDNKETKKYRL